jgi:hypothetical protein
MGILLALEMGLTVLWLAGVLISGSYDGVAPWGKLDWATANGWCRHVGLITFIM